VLEGGVNGIWLIDSNSEGSLNIVGGTIEGLGIICNCGGVALKLNSTGLPSSITGTHFEANYGADVVLQKASNVRFSAIFSDKQISLYGDTRNVTISDTMAQNIFIDIGDGAYTTAPGIGTGAKRIILQNITTCSAPAPRSSPQHRRRTPIRRGWIGQSHHQQSEHRNCHEKTSSTRTSGRSAAADRRRPRLRRRRHGIALDRATSILRDDFRPAPVSCEVSRRNEYLSARIRALRILVRPWSISTAPGACRTPSRRRRGAIASGSRSGSARRNPLRARESIYGVRYRTNIDLGRVVTATYTGPLERVVARLLDGYDFILKTSAGGWLKLHCYKTRDRCR